MQFALSSITLVLKTVHHITLRPCHMMTIIRTYNTLRSNSTFDIISRARAWSINHNFPPLYHYFTPKWNLPVQFYLCSIFMTCKYYTKTVWVIMQINKCLKNTTLNTCFILTMINVPSTMGKFHKNIVQILLHIFINLYDSSIFLRTIWHVIRSICAKIPL